VLTFANVLTLLRMAAAPFLIILVQNQRFDWALGVFVAAGLTDTFDGFVARRGVGGHGSTLGAMLDPVADKVLLSSSMIVLTWGRGVALRIPEWLAVLTLSRDALILIAVLIINLTVGRRLFYPSLLGKLSTVAQIVTVGVLLLLNALGQSGFLLLDALYFATAGLVVASGFHYVYLAATGRSGQPLS